MVEIDKDRIYSLDELINLYNMSNLEFKYYGNNKNGTLDFYMKTDANKVSVFSSIDSKMSKQDYIKLNEEEARKIKFKFNREVDDLELDIVAIVLKTSDVNIPCSRYSLETLDKLTKEQDKEDRSKNDTLEDGIVYIIVDNNTGCSLYDGVYTFDKNNKGLIEDLKVKSETEESDLLKNNLNMILNYYESLDKQIEKSL